MFNLMICNITKIRIPLSICTSSEVVLSSMCSLKTTYRSTFDAVTDDLILRNVGGLLGDVIPLNLTDRLFNDNSLNTL